MTISSVSEHFQQSTKCKKEEAPQVFLRGFLQAVSYENSESVDGHSETGLAVGSLVLVDDALGNSLVEGAGSAASAAALSPAAMASRVARTAVFRLDFTATLRLCAFSLVRTRFFCDLMFATISPNDVCYKDIQTMMITWHADKSPMRIRVSRKDMPTLPVRIVCVEYFQRRMAWANSIISPGTPISR